MQGTTTTQATLNMWKQALSQLVSRQGPDLSSRQLAILLIVYLEEPPHTVRGLAARLKISKPAVTRALDTMSKLDLLKRKKDENDMRSVNIVRTVKGSVFLSEIADVIEKAAWENLG